MSTYIFIKCSHLMNISGWHKLKSDSAIELLAKYWWLILLRVNYNSAGRSHRAVKSGPMWEEKGNSSTQQPAIFSLCLDVAVHVKNKEFEYVVTEKGRKGLTFPLGVQNLKLPQVDSNLVCFVNPNSYTNCLIYQIFVFQETMFFKSGSFLTTRVYFSCFP